jgi:hypothetical protein
LNSWCNRLNCLLNNWWDYRSSNWDSCSWSLSYRSWCLSDWSLSRWLSILVNRSLSRFSPWIWINSCWLGGNCLIGCRLILLWRCRSILHRSLCRCLLGSRGRSGGFLLLDRCWTSLYWCLLLSSFLICISILSCFDRFVASLDRFINNYVLSNFWFIFIFL